MNETQQNQQYPDLSPRKAAEEQKFDELKNYVEGLNLNETLGHPEAAKIVHTLLYEQSQNHLDELDAKDQELAAANEKVAALEPVTVQLEEANKEIEQLKAEKARLGEDLDYYRKDATFQLNEVNRLKQQVQGLEQRLQAEKQRRIDINPSESLQQLLEGAKAVTEQRKRAITNVQPLNEKGTHYTAQDADTGEHLTIPHYALKAYEQVERLRMPEEDKPVTEEQFPAGGQDVADAAVVQGDAGTEASGGDDATVPEAATTMSDAEIAARFQRIETELGLKIWEWDGEA